MNNHLEETYIDRSMDLFSDTFGITTITTNSRKTPNGTITTLC